VDTAIFRVSITAAMTNAVMNCMLFCPAGIKGVWSLRSSWMDAYDSHLVLSFVGETRLLAISEEDVLDEASIAGVDGGSQTLLAATTLHDQLLQVGHK
jgi:hypothetical protein